MTIFTFSENLGGKTELNVQTMNILDCSVTKLSRAFHLIELFLSLLVCFYKFDRCLPVLQSG